MYSIHNRAIRWLIPDFQSDVNSNVCSTSHHLRDIRTNNSAKRFDLKNGGQVQRAQEWDLDHSSENVRIHLVQFSEFYLYGNKRLCKR